ncbi:MAG: CsbD family protein [Nocardioidaceae bacterium]
MGKDDKLKNSTEGAVGKAKETLGKSTNDKSMEREGKTEQSKADLKQAGEKAKDAFKK